MKTFVTVALGCALAVTFAGCGQKAGGKHGRTRPSAAPVPIATTAARAGSVTPTLTLAGIIAPYQNVAITGSLSEPTLRVNVNEGDIVHKGEVLAVQDTTDLEANLAAQVSLTKSDDARVAQARYTADLNYGQNPDAVTQARATLRQSEQTLKQAYSDADRYRQLVTQGYLSQQQYVQQETTVANAQAGVRSAQAALASAITNNKINGSSPDSGLQGANIDSAAAASASSRAQENQIRAQISHATIYSPVDGIVINRNLNPGEYPGSRTIFTVQELSRVYATLNASSADVFAIPNGAKVSVSAGDDRSGRHYAGTIVAVLGQVQPGSTNFTVKALLQNPNLKLQAGIPVTAVVELPKVSGIAVPSTAFLDDSHTTLMVDRDDKAVVAHVKDLGSAGTTSIVSGVSADDTVVTNGQLGLTNGQKISER